GEFARGRLVMKRVLDPKPPHPMWIAWRTERSGKALAWFLERTGEIRRVFQSALTHSEGTAIRPDFPAIM
ncbi:MAG: hypothetical protein ACREXY_17445, partial [Gammaproteobacteria bacterium]